ncbi:MAG: glycosyltransferase family 2 protein [Synechococcus sp. MED-G135]|nr:MAG: glycosyltransferase family 2 protein [Synechococcus sp. MED-G135]
MRSSTDLSVSQIRTTPTTDQPKITRMLENWQGLINTLLIAWAVRTFLLLHFALQNRRAERIQAAKTRGRSKPSAGNPLISIIIPAFNEEATIGQTMLSCLKAKDYNMELIVIDDGSTDNTKQVARMIKLDEPNQRISILPTGHNQGKTAALNLGLSHARGEFIVTLDADTQVANSETINSLIEPLINQRSVTASTANLKISDPTTTLGSIQAIEYAKIIQTVKRAQSQTNAILILPGALSAFRAEALKSIGGFSGDTLAEDADATMTLLRQGHRLSLETKACGITDVPSSLQSFTKQRIRWRVGQLQCLWKHRQLPRQSLATCLFYIDVANTNLISAITPAIIIITAWQAIRLGDWQSSAWAAGGFIGIDILITALASRLDKTLKPSPRTYIAGLLFFATINPVITWLSLIKLTTSKKLRW